MNLIIQKHKVIFFVKLSLLQLFITKIVGLQTTLYSANHNGSLNNGCYGICFEGIKKKKIKLELFTYTPQC